MDNRRKMNCVRVCLVVVTKFVGQPWQKKVNGERVSLFNFRLDWMYSNGRPWALRVVIRRNRYLSNRSKSVEWLIRPSRRVVRLVETELMHPPLDPVNVKIVLSTLMREEEQLNASAVTPRRRTHRRAVEDVTNVPRALKMIISK